MESDREEYVVQCNDTLRSISIREGISIGLLKRLNKLSSDTVYPGQVLKVSARERNSTHSFQWILANARDSQSFKEWTELSNSSQSTLPNSVVNGGNTSFFSVSPISIIGSKSMELYKTIFGSYNADTADSNHNITIQASIREVETSIGSNFKVHQHDTSLIGHTDIINKSIIKQLNSRLPTCDQLASWSLLYSVLQHGTDISTFYRNTRKQKRTILFIKTIDGDIFGGFNSDYWKSSSTFCK